MPMVKYEYKLEGLSVSGEWLEVNPDGVYSAKQEAYDLLRSHLIRIPKPVFKNYRIMKRPTRTWSLVLNVAINGEG